MMNDAETIMGETGVIYVCAVCGDPVESEPCREHQQGQYITMYLEIAKPGARCKAPGFTDWVKTRFNGWAQDETGWHVADGFLGNMIAETGYRLEFEPSPTALNSETGDKP